MTREEIENKAYCLACPNCHCGCKSKSDREECAMYLTYINCYDTCSRDIDELESENKALKAQIEQMKCCANCEHSEFYDDYFCSFKEEDGRCKRNVHRSLFGVYEEDLWELAK